MYNPNHVHYKPCAIHTMYNPNHVHYKPCAIQTICNANHLQSKLLYLQSKLSAIQIISSKPSTIQTIYNSIHVQSNPNQHQSTPRTIYTIYNPNHLQSKSSIVQAKWNPSQTRPIWTGSHHVNSFPQAKQFYQKQIWSSLCSWPPTEAVSTKARLNQPTSS